MYDTGKDSSSDSRKHVDKYESTTEGGCRGSLSQLDGESEKPGSCRTADNYRSDKGKGKSADGFGVEGKCKNCSADHFEDYGRECKGKGCGADSFNGDNVKGRPADSYSNAKGKGKDADRYDTGKDKSSDSRKHVDKYESTTEGGCRAELECTEE